MSHTENERKFVVKSNVAQSLIPNPVFSKQIFQFMLFDDGNICGRVRNIDNSYILTFKSSSTEQIRDEVEVGIDFRSADKLYQMSCGYILHKTRYNLNEKNSPTVFLDIFLKELNGLIVAEVEDPPIGYNIPSWFGKEVTGIPEFYTNNLCSSEETRKSALQLYKNFTS